MPAPTKNIKFYAEWAEYIDSDKAKSAYHVQIGVISAMKNFSC
jgi:hypothetical protein